MGNEPELGEQVMFYVWIVFEPSKSAISLISVEISCIFMEYFTLCTSYNKRPSNAHNLVVNGEELSEENMF
jgi:hypothetical protein